MGKVLVPHLLGSVMKEKTGNSLASTSLQDGALISLCMPIWAGSGGSLPPGSRNSQVTVFCISDKDSPEDMDIVHGMWAISHGRTTVSLPGTRQVVSPGFFCTGIRMCSAGERSSKVKAGHVLGQAHKQLRWKKRKSLVKISEVDVLKISIILPSRTVFFNSQPYRSSIRAMHRSSHCHALYDTISMAGVKLDRVSMFWSPMKHFLPGTIGSETEVACHGQVLYTLVWFSVVLPWAVFLDQWGEIFLPQWICLFSFKVSLKDPEEKAGCTGNVFLFVCACCGIFICSINLCMFKHHFFLLLLLENYQDFLVSSWVLFLAR